ncbi:MAG: N-acetyltransferase family protein [Planctomycetota bacterium]
MNGTSEEVDRVVVRELTPKDLDAVVDLDEKVGGRRRNEYFRLKLQQALAETGIKVSLAAELDGRFAGFGLARVFYGEFGAVEKVAVLDTFGVHPDLQGQGVARALLRQLRTNLLGLGIRRLQTEVAWQDAPLLAFFQHAGSDPPPRLALDLDLEAGRRREETADAPL